MYLKFENVLGLNKVKFLMVNFRKLERLMLLLISIGKEMLKEYLLKSKFYDKQNFIATNKFMDLCYDYLEFSLGFQGILKVSLWI